MRLSVSWQYPVHRRGLSAQSTCILKSVMQSSYIHILSVYDITRVIIISPYAPFSLDLHIDQADHRSSAAANGFTRIFFTRNLNCIPVFVLVRKVQVKSAIQRCCT